MTLQTFNTQNIQSAQDALYACCGSTKWATYLAAMLPIESESTLIEVATSVWYNECNEADWLEAFTQHPKIGDIKSLEEKFASTKHLASNEQSGVANASYNIIEELAAANEA